MPLDFRRGARPPNYLARAMQVRLLLLVLALGLVIVLAIESRKAKYYWWVVPQTKHRAESSAEGTVQTDHAVDTRVSGNRSGRETPESAPPNESPSEPPTASAANTPAQPTAELFDRRPTLAEQVRDDRKVVPSEWDEWLHLFDVLNRADQGRIEAASLGPVTFVQLFDESDYFRGRVVSTRGRIRRAHRASPPRNEFGLTTYYQLWLQPDDHPRDPIAVWCLQLPVGFPTGMEIDQQVQVTGFYFKRMAYLAGNGKWRRAPLLLARTIRWQRAQEAAAPTPPAESFWFVVPIALGGSLLAIVLVYLRTRGPTSPVRAGRAVEMEQATGSPEEVARRLQQLAGDSPPAGSEEQSSKS